MVKNSGIQEMINVDWISIEARILEKCEGVEKAVFKDMQRMAELWMNEVDKAGKSL